MEKPSESAARIRLLKRSVGAVSAAVVMAVAAFAPLVRCLGAEDKERRPNILLAVADDWGWPHAGAYGDPVVKTPAFDRVAREGAVFTNAFVSSPSCTPSRSAVLTGQWHWRLEESANLWSTLQAKFPVYPDLLEEAGYYVGYTGKGWGPGKVEIGGRKRNAAGDYDRDFDAFLAKRPDGKPFCFWFGRGGSVGYKKGLGQKSGMKTDQIRLPACLPDSEEVRSDVADYYFAVQEFDRAVGGLLKKLEELGELDNTLVVITGDQGAPIPRGGHNLYDTGARVPLAVRWGSKIKAGRTVTDFVSLTDLAPTFLQAAGLKPPKVMTGRSFLDVLKSAKAGRVDASRHWVLIGKERHVPCQEAPDSGGTPMRAIRTDDFLYIRNFRPDRWPAGTPNHEKAYLKGSWYGDINTHPAKTYMFEHRNDPEVKPLFELAFGKRPDEELYDLKMDPEQLYNVAGDPAYAEVKQKLADRLIDELRASADPRVLGNGDKFDTYPYYGGTPKYPGFDQGK